MPRLEIEGVGVFDVPKCKRLVLAIEEDAGGDIMHEWGSYARCTTCRVEFLEGEPEEMTQAEMMVLDMRDLIGKVRLSCHHDMKVCPMKIVSGTGSRESDPLHPPAVLRPPGA